MDSIEIITGITLLDYHFAGLHRVRLHLDQEALYHRRRDLYERLCLQDSCHPVLVIICPDLYNLGAA